MIFIFIVEKEINDDNIHLNKINIQIIFKNNKIIFELVLKAISCDLI